MKLVEILARELSEWPDGYVSIVQSSEPLTLPIEDGRDIIFRGSQWDYQPASMDIYDAEFECSQLATDYATAIITREMWEAEKYSLFGNCEDMTKEAFNPLQSRDRIYEIDILVESLEEERASLVQGLEDEGFKLIIGKGVK